MVRGARGRGIRWWSFGAALALVFVVFDRPIVRAESIPVAGNDAAALAAQAVERCRWSRDVAFFVGLENGKPFPSRDEIGCTAPLTVSPAGASGLEGEIRVLVSGYPLERMAAAIARYDRNIAGLIVGIGKKESDWGVHTPKLAGEECFNYWGYRAPGNRGLTPDGYGCFEKPEDAVQAIGDRLVSLAALRAGSDPSRMIVWKCGSSCAGHSPESVAKWIADVSHYYQDFVR